MLDNLDLSLINLLQRNARKPIAQLAQELGQPIPTIRDRVKRLELKGIIIGYKPTLDLIKIGYLIKTIVQVRVSNLVTDPSDFLTALGKIPEVESAYLVTGDIEAVVILNVKNVEDLRRVIYEEITKVPGVSGTNTMLVLAEDHWQTQFNTTIQNNNY